MASLRGVRAIERARAEKHSPSAPAPRIWEGLCLMFVRTCLGVPRKYDSAIEAWHGTATIDRHADTNPPMGVPVFWRGGKYGHVALSAGDGFIYSNDIRRKRRIDKVRLDLISRRWGLTYLGWTETVNGKRVFTPTTLSVAEMVAFAERNGRYPSRIAKALAAEGCSDEIAGYAKWQRKLGYRGANADGFAGVKSLTELGNRHGFKVAA